MDFRPFLHTRLGQAALASVVAMTIFALSNGSFVEPGLATAPPTYATWMEQA